MSEQITVSGGNIIMFPLARRNTVRTPDNSFLAEYERLVRAFRRIRNPKTRAMILELLKASGARERLRGSGP